MHTCIHICFVACLDAYRLTEIKSLHTYIQTHVVIHAWLHSYMVFACTYFLAFWLPYFLSYLLPCITLHCIVSHCITLGCGNVEIIWELQQSLGLWTVRAATTGPGKLIIGAGVNELQKFWLGIIGTKTSELAHHHSSPSFLAPVATVASDCEGLFGKPVGKASCHHKVVPQPFLANSRIHG